MQQLCGRPDRGRQRDQLQQHGADGVDQLLVSGRGHQRGRHLRLLEYGVGDDTGDDPGSRPIRINTGGPAFTDTAGQAWSADQAFTHHTPAAGPIRRVRRLRARSMMRSIRPSVFAVTVHTTSRSRTATMRSSCTSRRFGIRPRISACSMSRSKGRWSSTTSISSPRSGHLRRSCKRSQPRYLMERSRSVCWPARTARPSRQLRCDSPDRGHRRRLVWVRPRCRRARST